MIQVVSVKPLSDYRLEIGFNNTEVRVFDVKPYINKGIFTELQNEIYFKKVSLLLGSITWENGQDFSPETLYLKSVPVLLAA